MNAGMRFAVVAALLGTLLMGSHVVNGQGTATTGGGASTKVETSGSSSVQISTSTASSAESGENSPEPRKQDTESPKEQQPSFNEVVENLRIAWGRDDVNEVANVLDSTTDVEALAEGFRFDSNEREVVLEKSDNRDEDPDVIAVKGIAKSALDTGDVEKLAAVMVLSALQKRDAGVEAELVKILSDRELMRAVLNADADKEFVPHDDIKEKKDKDPSTMVSTSSEVSLSGGGSEAAVGGQASASIKSSKNHGGDDDDDDDEGDDDDDGDQGSSGGRRLAGVLELLVNEGRNLKCDGCSPANSLVCASCWAADVCKPFHWCS
ncbi:hypothetical protein BSKO_05875 [Bryopsis sp. KO-2023]|nr:hypothetical protein BSKO_05875 [Bryopsis sp. KO-2023]